MDQPSSFAELLGDSPLPLRLVLLAGEQVMPNLESVLICLRSGRLASVHIACTGNTSASAEPARRLKRLLDTLEPRAWGARTRAVVRISHPALDGTSQAVSDWASTTMDAFPESQWVLNLTGGLKPMSFGLLDMLRREATQGIYLERGQGWMRIVHERGATRSEPLELPQAWRDQVDDIPVAQLVGMQLASSDAQQEHLNVSSDELPDLGDMHAFTQRLIASDWDFAGVFRDKAIKAGNGGHGPAFEAYLGNVLRCAGVGNLTWSLKLSHGPTQVLECDLVACHRGQVVLLDLKLSDADASTPPHEQIRSAHTAMRNLGGLAASAVLVRPNWNPEPALQAMANAHRIALLDAPRCAALLDELARVMRLAPAGMRALAPISAAIADYHRRHGHAFLTPGHPKRRQSPAREPNGALALLSIIEQASHADGRNWIELQMGGSRLLAVVKPASASRSNPALEKKLGQLLRSDFVAVLIQRDVVLLKGKDAQRFAHALPRLQSEFPKQLPLGPFLALPHSCTAA